MSQKVFKNISNHTSATNFHNTYQSQMNTIYNQNYEKCITPIIIKRNTRKTCTNLLAKKSVKQMMPKYLTKPLYGLQKQKLLHEIEKENQKLKHQHLIKKNLERKLEKKQSENQKKMRSLQKSNKNQPQSIQGIQRKIHTSVPKPFLLKAKQENYIKSAVSQLELLNQQIQKNQSTILKIKQSKKYTRYLQNEEEKNTFFNQFKSLRQYTKKLKTEIKRLKRVHLQKKKLKIKQLQLQGQIQSNVQMQNIQIYKLIQDINFQLKETISKKSNLQRKKEKLQQEIEQMKAQGNITDDFIQNFYRKSNKSPNRLLSPNLTASPEHRTYISNLESLREEDGEEEDSQEKLYCSDNAKKKSFHSKDSVKENQGQDGEIPSEKPQFQDEYEQNDFDSQQRANEQTKRIRKLEQKYFCDQEESDFDEQFQGQCSQNHRQKGASSNDQSEDEENEFIPQERYSNRPERGITF